MLGPNFESEMFIFGICWNNNKINNIKFEFEMPFLENKNKKTQEFESKVLNKVKYLEIKEDFSYLTWKNIRLH